MNIFKVKRINNDYYINGNDIIIPAEQLTWDNPYYLEIKRRGFPVPDVPEQYRTTLEDKEKLLRFEKAVTQHLDSHARQKGYDDIKSAALRAALPRSPFHAEGIAYGEWMDEVWAYCYQELDKIRNRQRTEPTIAEFIAELPVPPLGV